MNLSNSSFFIKSYDVSRKRKGNYILTVILINPFEVPACKDEEFLAHWNEIADKLRQEPGFISTRLRKVWTPGQVNSCRVPHVVQRNFP